MTLHRANDVTRLIRVIFRVITQLCMIYSMPIGFLTFSRSFSLFEVSVHVAITMIMYESIFLISQLLRIFLGAEKKLY